ncbi:acetoacetate--CoA ligase [Ochrobactrum sp. Marseille-Q0166]|uniref:acetoacetate--CoA ligase n=1 Tax=Ochrobactrum sp. Marseille-Q0166 TaxID=2761105 RepID=UPI001655BF58|nr:acetoacetate--CoA ligase [Ochrobactrum sp. Marseille-Q0166]MBC8716204.1 acetoacetate--CoA ligase [Ochrobactrum sp. Marseille-Q0166]
MIKTASIATQPLWRPDASRITTSALEHFRVRAEAKAGRELPDFQTLHSWSVEDRAAFWTLLWDFCGVIGERGQTALVDRGHMREAKFFPDAKLNFAENLLRYKGNGEAIIFRGEDKVERRLTWHDLHALVSKLQQFMLAEGVKPGDRIAGMMPNMPEAVALMLAASSIGAVWSSCSPDFGAQGVLDRFGQIDPKLFFACDGYWYNGKRIDVSDKVAEVAAKLPDCKRSVIVTYLGEAEAVAGKVANGIALDAALNPIREKAVEFMRLPFDHPIYILFSSGTTGIPKCIVHRAGGVLLQHLKEHSLHADIREGDRFFYFTTCGWMMWNWLASGIASGATLLLYDGSPFYPDGNVLFDYAASEDMTYFGTSAKFIDAVLKAGLRPGETHNLSALRTISSTGSPLSPEGFAFVYEAIKGDVHLASISGGTDIVSCFVLGVPTEPVWQGEIQGAGLGMAVDVWDDNGKPVRGEKGELVCAKAFPCMPLQFWNDPEGAKYQAAYFERFDNIWCHGDFAEWTQHDGIIIHGRSDATLNPGGVRIGTAEIYNQVEQMAEVAEALCIGQDWDNDVRVVLFVRLVEGESLDEDLKARIKTKIRTGATPRHVPAKIVAVSDIPRTKSGKIVELAVRDIVHGREVKNREALANPQALELYREIADLQQG